MLHPNSEDESVNSLSQESHDPVLETRVLRWVIDHGYVVIMNNSYFLQHFFNYRFSNNSFIFNLGQNKILMWVHGGEIIEQMGCGWDPWRREI